MFMLLDLLDIQISIMAFESAFSTSSRIIDIYRTNLSAPIIETLPIVDNIEDNFKDDDIAKGDKQFILLCNRNFLVIYSLSHYFFF
uniref:HAT C-terminal dimerisation domain-containing protein n=1 Tax=Lactuca sativa TaxID=4236 RepID=A0A9R1X1P7_LACSA|nr:hypothetical protein LSAT_V11C800417890 [Lactuca sativa]